MEQLSAFIGRHWLLSLIFVILVLILVLWEQRDKAKSAKHISPAELVNKMNHHKAVVVDLRDGAAFSKGHIAQAVSIATTDIEAIIRKLKTYKANPLVLYGATSARDSQIIARLAQEGVTDVYVLAGGINAWNQAGLPLVKE